MTAIQASAVSLERFAASIHDDLMGERATTALPELGLGYTPVTAPPLHSCPLPFAPVRIGGGDLSRRRPVSVAPVRDSFRVGGRQTCDDDPPFFTPPPAPRASRPSPR